MNIEDIPASLPASLPAETVIAKTGFAFSGFIRSLVGVTLAGPIDERLIHRDQLFARARYHREHFEGVVSGSFSFDLFESQTQGNSFNGFNGATQYEFTPELRELWVGLYWSRFEWRIGQQRLAWGASQLFAPNDVINSRDLRDPMLSDDSLFYLPLAMLRSDIDIGVGSLQLMVTPFAPPDRMEMYGHDWAFLQNAAGPRIRALLAAASADPARASQLSAFADTALRAPLVFSDAQAGAHFAGTFGIVDVDAFYHYGFDSTPLISENTLTASYVRRHHVGADVAINLSSGRLSFDAAFDSTRVLYDRDFFAQLRPSTQLVLSFEHHDKETQALAIEVSYARIFGAPFSDYFFVRPDNVALAAAWHALFFSHLVVDLRPLLSLLPWTLSFRAQVGVKLGGLEIDVGALGLLGEARSYGDYYSRNSQVYALTRYSF